MCAVMCTNMQSAKRPGTHTAVHTDTHETRASEAKLASLARYRDHIAHVATLHLWPYCIEGPASILGTVQSMLQQGRVMKK